MALSKLSSNGRINCVALIWAAKRLIRNINASCCWARCSVERFCDTCYDVYIQINETPIRNDLYTHCRDIYQRFFNNLYSVEFQQAVQFIEDSQHHLANIDRCGLNQFFKLWFGHFDSRNLSRQMFKETFRSNFFDPGIISLRERRDVRRYLQRPRGCTPVPPRPALPTFVLDRGFNHGQGLSYLVYKDISNSKYVYHPIHHDWTEVFQITTYKINKKLTNSSKCSALQEWKYICTARYVHAGDRMYVFLKIRDETVI
ncbi:hypothetical protein DPMN_022771 [Dreissena polymorpha]|uniref:Uncharacterized protein n=1 Tax=Dreissena polymorpha TaxID=45954 RepID=A0A9D4NP49_DREPO|nr:hypothetical protein DPMN_022771 [Dreissena polymorpha]